MTIIHSDSIIQSNTFSRGNPMPVSNYNRTRDKYRITLEVDVHDDYNPRDINWEKVLDLHEDEHVETYIEDLSYSYWDL